MRYGSTKGYRRSNRYRRYRRSYATRTRRTRRRYYRRRAKTISSVVKLTYESGWTFYNGTSWAVFSFNPLLLPGFKDYQATYSHFRLLKAKLYINRQMVDPVGAPTTVIDGSTWNYLVVGSRPFAATTSPLGTTVSSPTQYLPNQLSEALRQTKWQRVHYPNTTTQRVTAGFYPYTMVGTFGPSLGSGSQVQYQRIWEGKKWMPFTWALDQTSSTDRPMAFYGPYLVADWPTDATNPGYRGLVAQCTLQVHVQFKGQR